MPDPDHRRQQHGLDVVRDSAWRHRVAVAIGMEGAFPLGLHNVAFVIGRDGEIAAYQAKNQIPPEEELDSRATGLCAQRFNPAFFPPA